MVHHLNMPRALISIGSNLGNRQLFIDSAVDQLRAHTHIHNLAIATLSESEPIGGPDGQGRFLNGAAVFDTSLSANELLAVLQQIENDADRTRDIRWDARTFDLDLALYDNQIIDSESLIVPHPRMISRKFILQPAAEIAGDIVVPSTGWTIKQHLHHLQNSENSYLVFAAAEPIRDRLQGELQEATATPDVTVLLAADPSVHVPPTGTRLAIIVGQARRLCPGLLAVPCSIPWIYVKNSKSTGDEIIAAIEASQ